MLAAILVFLQATTAVVSFVYGALSLLPTLTHENRKSLFAYHLVMLVATTFFLTGVIVAYWSYLGDGQRIISLGLFSLSLFMVYHSVQARTALYVWSDDWLERYSEHIGFTVIALFEGFVIATGADFRTPSWFTGSIAVLGLVVGDRVLHGVAGAGGESYQDRNLRRILGAFRSHPARVFYPIQGGATDGHSNGSDAMEPYGLRVGMTGLTSAGDAPGKAAERERERFHRTEVTLDQTMRDFSECAYDPEAAEVQGEYRVAQTSLGQESPAADEGRLAVSRIGQVREL